MHDVLFYKPTNRRVIVPTLQIVHTEIRIVVVTPIRKVVIGRSSACTTVRIGNGSNAPSIVLVLYELCTCGAVYSNNVSATVT